ncbi:hypothetical protein [Roseovarius mucosus]|uniref:hypothetical protein n=1 Tax=Roseovarius mucosus TaxID=215743 RepID=UPI0012F87B99|nr:hypothetical protein [Roseovarius mucosus]
MEHLEKIQDTLVVPARPQGFQDVFLGQRKWTNIRLHKDKVQNIVYLAAYVTKPVSAITHYAEVERIENSEKEGRYTIYFKGSPVEIKHIGIPKMFGIGLQGPRYTTIEKLLAAHDLNSVFK